METQLKKIKKEIKLKSNKLLGKKRKLENKKTRLDYKKKRLENFINEQKQKLRKLNHKIINNNTELSNVQQNISNYELIQKSCGYCLNWNDFKKQYHKSSFIQYEDQYDDSKLLLPSFIYKTYFEFNNDILDKIFQLCLENKMILCCDDKKQEFCNMQFQIEERKFYSLLFQNLHKQLHNIDKNCKITHNGTTISVGLIRKLLGDKDNLRKKYLINYFIKKFKNIVTLFMMTKLPKCLVQLILTKYFTFKNIRDMIPQKPQNPHYSWFNKTFRSVFQ